jgi:hypothetical protein
MNGCLDTTHPTAAQELATWVFSFYAARARFEVNNRG